MSSKRLAVKFYRICEEDGIYCAGYSVDNDSPSCPKCGKPMRRLNQKEVDELEKELWVGIGKISKVSLSGKHYFSKSRVCHQTWYGCTENFSCSKLKKSKEVKRCQYQSVQQKSK